MKTKLALIALCALAACETPLTPRYSVSPDNVAAMRALGAGGIAVGTIAEPATYNVQCRMAAHLRVTDNLTHAQYIRKALEDELTMAGLHADANPRVTISGNVEELNASSLHGITHGEWLIRLHLVSSNGHQMTTSEAYRFRSGFSADSACRNVAEAYLPAVQDLIHQVVTSPEFRAMVE